MIKTNDHEALTALTSAMYVDAEGKEVTVDNKDGGFLPGIGLLKWQIFQFLSTYVRSSREK